MKRFSTAGRALIPLTTRMAMGGCDPATDSEATAWVKQHAIPFSSSQAGRGFDDLRPLKAIIADARLVSLGSPRTAPVRRSR